MTALHVCVLAGLLAAAAAYGCSEDPQVLRVTGEKAAQTDQNQAQRRERTLRQSESERIY